MIDPNNFWSSNYYEHPSITDEMIRIAESRLSIKLPASYVDLLRIQNGGYTHGFAFPMTQRTSWADDHVPLHDLAGIVIDPQHRTAENLLDTEYMTNEWGLPRRQALLSGDGHWWISLDYRNGPTPSVIRLDVECDQQVQIAQTFDDFLNGLVLQTEFGTDGE
ncbi:MAG TPA: SMI1/KNR4 family protein [Planctomicrobium sp.]|nr:SMI1/KNR4 family protein [Planctomicrobium sp.]